MKKSPGGRFIPAGPDNLNMSPYEIQQYWTPERKKAARPTHMGHAGLGAYTPKKPPADNAPPASDPQQADLSQYPFHTGGKLFYTMDGEDFVASGNIFMHGNMLLTAAHCVQSKFTGNVGEHFSFERGYTGELSAEGFSFKTIAVREEWYETKDVKYDYAIVILNGMSSVDPPLRYAINQNLEGKTVTAYGYPTKYFDGAQMMYVTGPVSAEGGHWVMRGSQMAPGASGGAWVLEDQQTAVGLNAFVSFDSKGEIVDSGSCVFDDAFDSLYKYALTLM